MVRKDGKVVGVALSESHRVSLVGSSILTKGVVDSQAPGGI